MTTNHSENGGTERSRRGSAVGRYRQLLSELMKEGLSPARAAAAVFVGCFMGVVPIYGLQSVVAIGLAVLMKLNKPLTFAATFVNNPILQPFLVFASIELGHLFLHGRFLPPRLSELRELAIQQQLGAWLLGSVVLGLILGGVAAGSTYVFLGLRRGGKRFS